MSSTTVEVNGTGSDALPPTLQALSSDTAVPVGVTSNLPLNRSPTMFSTTVEVNGTKSDALSPTLHALSSDSVVPVGITSDLPLSRLPTMSSTTVEVNGTESDALPPTLNALSCHSVVPVGVTNNLPLSKLPTMSSTTVEVNGTESDASPLTLHALSSDFVVPVGVTSNLSTMSSTTVGVNGTEPEALPLTLQTLSSDFVYNEDESPVLLTVPDASLVHDKSVERSPSFTTNESITTTAERVSQKRSLPSEERPEQSSSRKSRRLSSSTALVVGDCQQSPENESFPGRQLRRSARLSPVTTHAKNTGRNKPEGLGKTRRSCELESQASKKEHTNVKSNKKQSKLKRTSFFVGEPVPENEAQERWGWRYELKGQRREGQSWILNAGEEDEVHINVICHYLQANVDGCIFNLGDCAHIKGDGKQKHIGRIVEFFKTSDDENYFRVQWFFRAEDTVMKQAAAFHDKKRLFFSTLMNDNLLDCILSKVRIIEKPPTLGFQSNSIQPSEYYCDMEYSVKYATFRALMTDSLVAKCDLTMSSSLDANNGTITTTPFDSNGCQMDKPELSLLDLYAGCGGMSTGLCLGAKLSGVKLVTRWAIDYHKSACDSLKQNHPETEVRHTTAEDFLELLKEWEKLCKLHVSDDPDRTLESSCGTNESTINESSPLNADVAPGEYEVSSLVDICYGDPSSTGQHGLRFKVRWKGYDPSEDTWELIEGLSDCQGHIQDFVRSGYKSKILPCPGDVDVICGGPPCQGISGYNRFRNTDDPLNDERNQQIIVFFDIVKILNPRYVLMENVADILRFDKASLGRYALSRLVHMNYQARLGIMAAGSYGLPQFRLRVFVWGAHPNERLPQFPLPTHEVIVRYFPPAEFEQNTVAYDEGQPRKLQEAVVLRDAISDLPAVTSHEDREEMTYEMPPETEFQKYIRLTKDEFTGSALKGVIDWRSSVLTDHRPYKLSEDDFHRVCLVPRRKGANFRDFPGLIVSADNTVHRDPTKEQVLLPSGRPLIPDYVFTFEKGKSKRPFARVWWDENVPTVVTFPNLHNQAAVHPEQDRVFTLRECARLQGFPDYYRFCGNIKERYCQVGNAVAVSVSKTLGYALGMAFRKLSGDEALMTLPPDFAFQVPPTSP